jgi:hypothetical protein
MTSQLGQAPSNRRGPEHTPRLRLKPKAPITGYVDGAWWPHSDDLTEELPDLLTVLSVRLGDIERVVYHLDEWATVPKRLVIGGRTVRLGGFRLQPPNTIEVLGLHRERILLLVVPPNTEADLAHEILMTAAAPDNASTVDHMLQIVAEERGRQVRQ